MKKITSKISYSVPNWAFCNVDKFDIDGSMVKQTCQFCKKSKNKTECLLYNETLSVSGDFIDKTAACKRATAGFDSTIDTVQEAPKVEPKKIIKHTVDLYIKTYKSLINDGYPQQMAEMLAKELIIGGK